MRSVRLFLAGALGLAFIAANPALEARAREPLKWLSTLQLPGVAGAIDHLAVDLKGARLFIAAMGNNTIEVIDVRTVTQTRSISGLAQPQGLVYSPAANQLLVANGADGSLRTYDGASLELVNSTRLGGDADNIRLEPAQQRIFVGYGVGALAVMNPQHRRAADIKVSSHPESFQLEAGGPRIFVNLPGVKEIAVLDRDTQTAVAHWPLRQACENSPMALDEADKRMFIVCRHPARLLVLNMDTGAIEASLRTVGDADDVYYDRVRRRIYVSGGEGAIAVYQQKSASQYWEMGRVATIAGARTSLFVPEWNRLFVVARDRGTEPAEIRVYAVQP